MNNYILVLTCCISVIAMTLLVGIALVLCTPLEVAIPVLIFALCAVASVDYQRWVGRK
jgi:ABC-type nickel/cobalt efflux system permease component RcnA